MFVSTTSQPAAKYRPWMASTRSGRVSVRRSFAPSLPPKSEALRSKPWIWVPMAPSKTRTRFSTASRNVTCCSPSAGTESRYLWRFAPPGKGPARPLPCKMRGHAGSTRRDADGLGHRARRGRVPFPALPRPRPLRRRGLLLDVVAPPGHGLLRPPAHGGLAHRGVLRDPPRRGGRPDPLRPLRRAGGGLRRAHRPGALRRPARPGGGGPPRRHLPHAHDHRRAGPARRAGRGGLRRRDLARGARPGPGLDPGGRGGGARAPLQVLGGAAGPGAPPPRPPRPRPAARAHDPLALAGRAWWRSWSSCPTSPGTPRTAGWRSSSRSATAPAPGPSLRSFFEYLGGLLGGAGVVALPLGLWRLARGRDSFGVRVAVATLLPIAVTFASALRGPVEANWSALVYPALCGAAAAQLARMRPAWSQGLLAFTRGTRHDLRGGAGARGPQPEPHPARERGGAPVPGLAGVRGEGAGGRGARLRRGGRSARLPARRPVRLPLGLPGGRGAGLLRGLDPLRAGLGAPVPARPLEPAAPPRGGLPHPRGHPGGEAALPGRGAGPHRHRGGAPSRARSCTSSTSRPGRTGRARSPGA